MTSHQCKGTSKSVVPLAQEPQDPLLFLGGQTGISRQLSTTFHTKATADKFQWALENTTTRFPGLSCIPCTTATHVGQHKINAASLGVKRPFPQGSSFPWHKSKNVSRGFHRWVSRIHWGFTPSVWGRPPPPPKPTRGHRNHGGSHTRLRAAAPCENRPKRFLGAHPMLKHV